MHITQHHNTQLSIKKTFQPVIMYKNLPLARVNLKGISGIENIA